jgi:hypothetical protein
MEKEMMQQVPMVLAAIFHLTNRGWLIGNLNRRAHQSQATQRAKAAFPSLTLRNRLDRAGRLFRYQKPNHTPSTRIASSI